VSDGSTTSPFFAPLCIFHDFFFFLFCFRGLALLQGRDSLRVVAVAFLSIGDAPHAFLFFSAPKLARVKFRSPPEVHLKVCGVFLSRVRHRNICPSLFLHLACLRSFCDSFFPLSMMDRLLELTFFFSRLLCPSPFATHVPCPS